LRETSSGFDVARLVSFEIFREAKMFDVFLSYNSKDRAQAEQLGLALKERSLSVWLDIWEIRPGSNWLDCLTTTIKEIKAAAVLVGRSGTGPWQQQEINALLVECVQGKKHVIPVLLQEAPVQPDLPPFLAGFSWVDLREGLTEIALDRLQWGITGIRPARLESSFRVADALVMEGDPRVLHEPPFAVMIDRLVQVWKPALHRHRLGALSLDEGAEVLFRSIAARMRPEWLQVLQKYETNNLLVSKLPEQEEFALRELRNLGLIEHDGPWLFHPTRSKNIKPTAAAQFVLELWHDSPPQPDTVRDCFELIHSLVREERNRTVLEKIRRTGRFAANETNLVRLLRNKNLVGHEAYYLAGTNRAILTPLGAHVLSHL
jgi:hypothetical protein